MSLPWPSIGFVLEAVTFLRMGMSRVVVAFYEEYPRTKMQSSRKERAAVGTTIETGPINWTARFRMTQYIKSVSLRVVPKVIIRVPKLIWCHLTSCYFLVIKSFIL